MAQRSALIGSGDKNCSLLNSSRTSLTSTTPLRQEDAASFTFVDNTSSSSIITSDEAPLISNGRSLSLASGTDIRDLAFKPHCHVPTPIPSSRNRLRRLFSSPHPIIDAAKSGNTSLVEHLISPTTVLVVDNTDNWTSLHYAAAFGRLSTLQLLLKHQACPDPRTKRQDRTPLFLAVQAGQYATAVALLDGGADIHAAGSIDKATPLHRAALEGDEKMVEMLLDRGASANSPDIEGLRPLMWAVQGNNPLVVELLVAAGAELEQRTQTSGLTALHRAVSSRKEPMVKTLLKLGANANADAPLGMRCLHRAAAAGDGMLVRLLVQEPGLDVNARTVKSWTPLHCAARYGHKEVCKILLQAGANKDAANRKGFTPEMLAKKWGFEITL